LVVRFSGGFALIINLCDQSVLVFRLPDVAGFLSGVAAFLFLADHGDGNSRQKDGS